MDLEPDIDPPKASRYPMLDEGHQEQQLNHLYIVEFLKSKTREDPKNPISSEVRRAAVKRANIGTEELTRVSIFAHLQILSPAEAMESESKNNSQCLIWSQRVIS